LYVATISLAVVLILQSVAWGKPQEKKPGKRTLTLQQLQEMALARSPSIEMARTEVGVSKSDLKQAESAYYPQFDATVVTGPAANADEPLVVNGRITDPSSSDIFDIGIFGRLDFTLTQPLYTFGKLSNRKEAALLGVKAKQVEIEQKKAEIVVRVKQLYYGMVLARQGMGVADESEEYLDDTRRRIKALIDAGSVNVDESDLYMVDAYSAEAKSFRAEAQKGERVAYFALKSLIGMPPEEDFDIDVESLPDQGNVLEAQEKYIQKALDQRPEMKQLKHGIDAQKYMVQAAKSDLYPSFFAVVLGSFAGAPGRDQFDSPYFTDEFNHAYGGFFAGLQWHFDFGIQQARVDKARAEYSKMLNTKAYAEENIPIQVANIYQEVLQYKTAMEAYEEAASASRKWVVVAFSNFDMGLGTAKRIFDAIDKYGQNRGRYLEALYNYNLALAQLEYAIGAISD
ncbi:MAG: TolC family protein, partial [Desulforhabdus sp.]|nr:TolC family protein [Desulforhabdus sp.]